jgi:hypothetical protein
MEGLRQHEQRYHLRGESLRAIGILPKGLKGRIEFAGNTSRTDTLYC